MPAGFQILLQDENYDVIDSAFVDARILGDAVAHMLRSMQQDNPQKEATIVIKWRKLARHAITTVDGAPAPLPAPPAPAPASPPASTVGSALRKVFK